MASPRPRWARSGLHPFVAPCADGAVDVALAARRRRRARGSGRRRRSGCPRRRAARRRASGCRCPGSRRARSRTRRPGSSRRPARTRSRSPSSSRSPNATPLPFCRWPTSGRERRVLEAVAVQQQDVREERRDVVGAGRDVEVGAAVVVDVAEVEPGRDRDAAQAALGRHVAEDALPVVHEEALRVVSRLGPPGTTPRRANRAVVVVVARRRGRGRRRRRSRRSRAGPLASWAHRRRASPYSSRNVPSPRLMKSRFPARKFDDEEVGVAVAVDVAEDVAPTQTSGFEMPERAVASVKRPVAVVQKEPAREALAARRVRARSRSR